MWFEVKTQAQGHAQYLLFKKNKVARNTELQDHRPQISDINIKQTKDYENLHQKVIVQVAGAQHKTVTELCSSIHFWTLSRLQLCKNKNNNPAITCIPVMSWLLFSSLSP